MTYRNGLEASFAQGSEGDVERGFEAKLLF